VYVADRGSHFGRRGVCMGSGKDVAVHHGAVRVRVVRTVSEAKACNSSQCDGVRSQVAFHRSYARGRYARLGQDCELFRCAEVDRSQRGSGGEEDKEGTARKSIVGVGESW